MKALQPKASENYEADELWCWVYRQGFEFEARLLVSIFHQPLENILDNFRHLTELKHAADVLSSFTDLKIMDDLTKFAKSFGESDIHNNYIGSYRTLSSTSKSTSFDPIARITLIKDQLPKEKLYFIFWVMGQAAIRVIEYHLPTDDKLEKIAKSITGQNRGIQWEKLGKILTEACPVENGEKESFHSYNRRLQAAVSGLSESERKKSPTFNRILKTARGEVDIPITKSGFGSQTLDDRLYELIKERPEQSNFDHIQQLINSAEDRQGENIVLFPPQEDPLDADYDDSIEHSTDVEPPFFSIVGDYKSPLQAKLSNRSIFLQTARGSHYLTWAWDRPHPPERKAFFDWIINSLNCGSLEQQLGSAIVHLAIETSRSLVRALDFDISNELSDEWRLTTDFSQLHRKRPIRHDAWLPKEEHENLINEFSTELRMAVPNLVSEILKRAASESESLNLSDNEPPRLSHLWSINIDKKVEPWFNEIARTHFPRLTSSKLANLKPQLVFESSLDSSLARLISSHKNSGLPASCGYDAWIAKEVNKHCNITQPIEYQLKEGAVQLGSVLTYSDKLLAPTIEKALHRLKESDQLIKQHNFLVQYTAHALYAATGKRYVIDPFDSLSHFNFKLKLVYINDKSNDGIHTGRLVPLPDQAITILRTYLKHLAKLEKLFSKGHPRLSSEIRKARTANKSKIPLLFQLDEGLTWHPVSKQITPQPILFSCGWPKNHFRHRYAQRLRSYGVDVEIIQAWMGHGERDVATYGDQSVRCILNDMDNNREAVNGIFDCLGFKVPKLPRLNTQRALKQLPTKETNFKDEIFGELRRKRQRSLNIKREIKNARSSITEILEGRPFDELEESDIKQLEKSMLLRKDGLAHPYAKVRLSILIKELQKADSHHLRSIKIRAAETLLEPSKIKDSVPEALNQYYALGPTIKKILASKPIGALGSIARRKVGIILLILEKRITYRKLIDNTLEGTNTRWVWSSNHFGLEFSEELNPNDWYAPVQRLQVSYKVASLLSPPPETARKASQFSKSRAPLALEPICEALGLIKKGKRPEFGELISKLLDVVEQANRVLLPGSMAAALSERCPPTSLCLLDQIRIATGRILRPPTTPDDSHIHSEDYQSQFKPRFSQSSIRSSSEAAKKFKAEIEDILADYQPSRAIRKSDEIKKECENADPSVPKSVVLLAAWIGDLMRRGKSKTCFSAYEQSTLSTYFSQLKAPFSEIRNDINLLSCSGDDITDFYLQVLEYKSDGSMYLGYVSDRIYDFHRWISALGADQPDWEDLAIIDDHRTVSPGTFCKDDIRRATKFVTSGAASENEKLLQKLALIFSTRFGARRNELIGLKRRDVRFDKDYGYIVTTENNQIRTLKTDASRRVVPELISLSDSEREVIATSLKRYDAIFGDDNSQPLIRGLGFDPVSEPNRIDYALERLTNILKTVTGSSRAKLHHGRHTFENTMEAILLPIDSPIANSLTEGLDCDAIQSIWMGTSGEPSRRTTAGIALAMGHYRYSAAPRNYNHLMTDWIDQLLPVPSSRRELTTVHNVRDWERIRLQDLPIIESNPEDTLPPPSLLNLFQFTFNWSNGVSLERSAATYDVDIELASLLADTLRTVSRGMVFKSGDSGNKWVRDNADPPKLLEYVRQETREKILNHEVLGSYGVADLRLSDLSPINIPSMFNARRAIHLRRDWQIILLRSVMEIFRIPHSQLLVAAKNNEKETAQRLIAHGFSLVESDELKDFKKYKANKMVIDGQHHSQDEMGLVNVVRSRESIIPDAYAMIVALIVVGIWQHALLTNE